MSMSTSSSIPLSWDGVKLRIDRLQRVVSTLSQLTPSEIQARINPGALSRSTEEPASSTASPYSDLQRMDRLVRELEENPKHQSSPVGHECSILLTRLMRSNADAAAILKLHCLVDSWEKSFRKALLTQYIRGEISNEECAKRLLDDELSGDLWRIHEGLRKIEQLLNIT